MIRAEFFRDATRFVANVDRNQQSSSAQPCHLQALQSHTSLAEDGNGIAEPNIGGLDRGDTIAERLQASSLAVRNAVIDLDQGNFRNQRQFTEASGQIESDDWPLSA